MTQMIVSKDGVRYPKEFAERHGIEIDREIDSPSGADRQRTTAAVGTVVTSDADGSVITSAAADSTSTTGVNPGLAAPQTDPATAEALAAQEAGKGELGTTGAPDNTTAGGTTGETTTTESGANDGGTTSGDSAAAGDADGTATAGSTTKRRSAKS